MELTKLNDDLDVIQKLDDEPNDVGGMSAEELKKKFDQAPNAIKEYINGVLIPGIVELLEGLNEDKAGRDELQGVVLNQIPDGTVTAAKLNTGAVTREKLAASLQEEISSHVKVADYAAATLPVSERLAESAGLQAPAFAEGVMAAMGDKVSGLMAGVEGTQRGNVWKTFRWTTFERKVSVTTMADYFSIAPASAIQISQSGQVSLADPSGYVEMRELPAEGVYFEIWTVNGLAVVRVGPESRAQEYSYIVGEMGLVTELQWIDLLAQEPYVEYLGTVTAEDAEAYPEDGWVGDVHYVKEAALSAKIARVETVERDGSGSYGAGAPTELKFSFPPRVVMVFGPDAAVGPWTLYADALGAEYADVGSRSAKRSEDGRTIWIYAADAAGQFNTVSAKYRIAAIG